MITNNPNPYQPQQTTPTPKSGGNKTGFIVAIAILAVAAIALLVMTISENKQKSELSASLNESERLKKEVEDQYKAALVELEEMRGSNQELNALIDKQKEELSSQKTRIEELLRDSKNLSAARGELKKLRSQMEQYVAEINQLRQQNEELTSQNTQLNESNTALQTDLESQKSAYQQSETARASLVSEKEELEKTRAALSSKVNFASVIKTSGLEAEGYKTKGNGKLSKDRSSKDVDQIQVCFNTTVNEVAEAGDEVYHIRIIDPQGTTMQVSDQGSGTFKSSSNGDEIPYSMTKEFNYSQSATQLCANWKPNQAFTKGTYKVEVYNKGYMAGNTSFTLK
ncbi:MAG: hypothetical protein SFU99_09730 [Saprospiraceae bacterium]|nr:hypothetical protein [Saprospiraceae bacterium]